MIKCTLQKINNTLVYFVFCLFFFQGLYISGVIGDRFNLRYVLSFGLCGSAVTVGILLKDVTRAVNRFNLI